MAINEERLNAFLGKSVNDLGAAISAVLISMGDELGFYKALAKELLSAMFGNGWATRPRADTSTTTPPAANIFSMKNRRCALRIPMDLSICRALTSSFRISITSASVHCRTSAAAPVWSGANTISAFFTARSASSAPVTT